MSDLNEMWLYETVDGLTHNYHSGGSALVIAASRADADAALRVEAVSKRDGPLGGHNTLDIDWSKHGEDPADGSVKMIGRTDAEPAVYIFEDAGCC